MSDVISPELRSILRRLKLGPILATLPERLLLARQQELSISARWAISSVLKGPG